MLLEYTCLSCRQLTVLTDSNRLLITPKLDLRQEYPGRPEKNMLTPHWPARDQTQGNAAALTTAPPQMLEDPANPDNSANIECLRVPSLRSHFLSAVIVPEVH